MPCCCAGGSEALESNTAIAQVLAKAVEKSGLPADSVQVVDTADRAAVMAMLTLDRFIDLIIPRGGEEFVRLVTGAFHGARAQARQGSLPRLC
jgi:glutamate-5-semialdehyde dehydrogenase